jgi:hypothetical protein
MPSRRPARSRSPARQERTARAWSPKRGVGPVARSVAGEVVNDQDRQLVGRDVAVQVGVGADEDIGKRVADRSDDLLCGDLESGSGLGKGPMVNGPMNPPPWARVGVKRPDEHSRDYWGHWWETAAWASRRRGHRTNSLGCRLAIDGHSPVPWNAPDQAAPDFLPIFLAGSESTCAGTGVMGSARRLRAPARSVNLRQRAFCC